METKGRRALQLVGAHGAQRTRRREKRRERGSASREVIRVFRFSLSSMRAALLPSFLFFFERGDGAWRKGGTGRVGIL
jgi:hypothetical protein